MKISVLSHTRPFFLLSLKQNTQAVAGNARRARHLADSFAPASTTRPTPDAALCARALSGAAPAGRPDEGDKNKEKPTPSSSSADPAEQLAASAAAAARAASEAASAAAAGIKARLGGFSDRGEGGGSGGGGSGPSSSSASQPPSSSLWAAIKREVAAAVLPEPAVRSVTRAVDPAAKGDHPAVTSSDLVAMPAPEPGAWEKQWERAAAVLGTHPAWARLSKAIESTGAVHKAREVADDLRDRWETADGPLAGRVAGAADALFAETEMAQALREVRLRDPAFDMVAFLGGVKADVPGLLRAYLLGDGPAMAAHASPDLVERVVAVHAAQAAAGAVPDSTILDVGDVELVDLKFLDGDPAAVVQFAAQQIACARDGAGSVVEGSANSVQRVFYLWALVQDAEGCAGTAGERLPPRWQLREMMVRGAHQLL